MVFFITGVGTGIGRETCLHVLANGHNVIGLLRSQTQAELLVNDAELLPGNLSIVFADLSMNNFPEEVSQFCDDNQIQQIDVLINVAGVLSPMIMEDFESSGIEYVMKVNFVSPTILINLLKPYLSKSKTANIINITSMSGFQGSVRFLGLSIYGASKAALNSVTESLAVELLDSNIHINALAIGAVDTEMLKQAFPDYSAPITPSQIAEYIFSFAISGYKFFNGKVIPVAIGNP